MQIKMNKVWDLCSNSNNSIMIHRLRSRIRIWVRRARRILAGKKLNRMSMEMRQLMRINRFSNNSMELIINFRIMMKKLCQPWLWISQLTLIRWRMRLVGALAALSNLKVNHWSIGIYRRRWRLSLMLFCRTMANWSQLKCSTADGNTEKKVSTLLYSKCLKFSKSVMIRHYHSWIQLSWQF